MQSLLIACQKCHRQYDVTGMEKGEHLRCRCGVLIEVPDKPVHEAKMVHCSACGGKLEAKATRCDYCGGEVSLTDRNLGPACPECFARLRAGARFCTECGVKIDPQILRGVRAAASCPRCKGPLVLREVPQGHYTECTACGGIWIDSDSFEKVVEKKDSAALGNIVEKSKKTEKNEARTETVKYVPCPVCGNLMHRKNYAGCSGVIVDWCKGHGFWFDTDELERVLSFIKSGGLDKSRKREIENAKSEIARLRDRKRSMATAGTGGWSSERNSTPEWSLDLGEAFTTLLRHFF